MVRKGSPVRVRQRAPQKPAANGGFRRSGATWFWATWAAMEAFGSSWRRSTPLRSSADCRRRHSVSLRTRLGSTTSLRMRAPPGLALTFRGGRDPDRPPRRGPNHTEPGGSAVAASPERQREIADFFADHERDVRQSVAYRVRQLPLPRSRMPVRRRGRSSAADPTWISGNRPRMIGDRGAARGVAALPSRRVETPAGSRMRRSS
jgi:hypothetical protein